MKPKRKIVPAPMYLRPEQMRGLNKLSATTRIMRAVLVREAIDDLLKKYKHKGGAK